jgi:hypothetical protein
MIHNVSLSPSVMELQASFDVLSAVVDGYESRGLPVEAVDATTDDAGDDGVRATVEVALPPSVLFAAGAEATADAATVADDGTLRMAFPTDGLLRDPASRPGVVSTTVESARVTEDGAVATVALVVDPSVDGDEAVDRSTEAPSGDEAATDGDEAATDGGTRDALAAVRDDSVPPFEDVPYLRRLYERCDTFAAMTRLFETDVSAETVRRYMIEAGVHDPDSYATDEPEEDEAVPDDLPVEAADVPADLTVGAVAEAVVDARTIYEVHRRIGLDQERTRDLLRRLDLLDLVTSRIDAAPDRRASPEEVAAHIRRHAPGDAYPADG